MGVHLFRVIFQPINRAYFTIGDWLKMRLGTNCFFLRDIIYKRNNIIYHYYLGYSCANGYTTSKKYVDDEYSQTTDNGYVPYDENYRDTEHYNYSAYYDS